MRTPGSQVGDEWCAVPPISDAFVVNFGDIAQVGGWDCFAGCKAGSRALTRVLVQA